MIYISSSSVRESSLAAVIEALSREGFRAIELSGGIRRQAEMEDLLLKSGEDGINFLCHNYFPPPPRDFVINLASLNAETYELSMQHARTALELSSKLGAGKYGIHAGFLIDIPVREIGKRITLQHLFDRDTAWKRFIESCKILLKAAAEKKLKLYIENNVFSSLNKDSFQGSNPFFVCESKEAERLLHEVPGINILCDLAHLYVSCKSLELDFEEESRWFLRHSDYIHLSGNDGLTDSNKSLEVSPEIVEVIKKYKPEDATWTFEVYSGMDDIKKSVNLLKEIL